MAGEPARDTAHREGAARLASAGERIARGTEADVAVAAALVRLEDDGWRAFRDLHWPGSTRSPLGHVVVGPGGVFVIDAKHWAGEVTLRNGVLCHDGHRREHEVVRAAEDALEVTSRLAGYVATPVLCFVGQPALAGWARDVLVTSVLDLADTLRARPVVFDAATVDVVAGMLQGVVRAAGAGAEGPLPARRAVPQLRARTTRDRSGPRVRGAIGALLGIVAVLVLLHYLPTIDEHPSDDVPALVQLGNAVTVHGTATTPRARVNAVVVRDNEITGRVQVRFTVRDLGSTPLALGQLWAQVVDTQDRIDGWRPTGRLSSASVEPGRQRNVVADFELPSGVPVEHVTLRLSGRADTLVRWNTH